MSDLIFLTLDLYLYDLRDTLGQTSEESEKNRENFKKKLPEELRSKLQHDRQFESDFTELFGKQRIVEFKTNTDPPHEGYYYPVRLNDTYGLLLSCSIADRQNPYPAKSIRSLNQDIEKRLNSEKPSLGRSWVIYGQLAYPDEQSPEEIAKICYRSLLPSRQWDEDLQGRNCIFNTHFFELSSHRIVLKENSSTENRKTRASRRILDGSIQDGEHVVIILYPNANIAERAATLLNFEWIGLFHYRAKILFSYGQSRSLKQWLKEDAIAIRECLQDIRNSNLKTRAFKKLQRTLDRTRKILPDYTIDLGSLNDQITTVEINLHDYQVRVQAIADLLTQEFSPTVSGQRTPFELTFLDRFRERVRDRYLLQMNKERDYFSSTLKTLEASIETTWAIVEIDRSRRDRNFQNTVAIVGVGLGAGSAAASISGQFPTSNEAISIAQLRQHPIGAIVDRIPGLPALWLRPVISGVYCLGVAFVFAGLTAIALALWERRPR
jgi:hypothetical protein